MPSGEAEDSPEETQLLKLAQPVLEPGAETLVKRVRADLEFMTYDPASAKQELSKRLEEISDTSGGMITPVRLIETHFFEVDNAADHMVYRALGREKLLQDEHTLSQADARRPFLEAAEDFPHVFSERSYGALNPKEAAALLTAYALSLVGAWSVSRENGLRAIIAWGNGRGQLSTLSHAPGPMRPASAEILQDYFSYRIADYEGLVDSIVEEGRKLAADPGFSALHPILAEYFPVASVQPPTSIPETGLIKQWDGGSQPWPDSALVVARLAESTVYFEGDESLLTVGAPGSGKSQGQVIPAILSSSSPLVVLDIKGELEASTAGALQARGTRILRFSLMDDDRARHCYNPMQALPKTSRGLWDKASQMAHLLVPASDKGDDIWVGNARVLLAVHICAVRLELGDAASLAQVARSIAGGKQKSGTDGETIRLTPQQRLEEIAMSAGRDGFDALADSADELLNVVSGDDGASSRIFQSVMTSLRSLLDMIRSESVTEATASSDWLPEDLRASGCNSCLFIQVKDVDIARFQPLLRLMIGQHLLALMESAQNRPEKPVTFILDELPQLGEFPEVIRAIEVGRGSRVRVWGFVQNVQQIRTTYTKANILLESTAVQCFMSYDLEAAEHLSKMLGTRHDPIKGTRMPVMEEADFFTRDMAGQMAICARGAQPFFVKPVMAHEVMKDQLDQPYCFSRSGYAEAAHSERDEEGAL